MRLSILIPTYNRKEYLVEALASALRELPSEAEIIVSDNNSSDGTREFLATHPDKNKFKVLIQEKNLGMIGNWNALMAGAKGNCIKILCDDDILLPGSLQRELALLEKNNSLALVASEIIEFESVVPDVAEGSVCEPRIFTSQQAQQRMLLKENIFGSPSAVMIRKKMHSQFSSTFLYAADWNAWIEILRNGSGALILIPGCAFRLHAENLTKKYLESGEDLLEVLLLRKKIILWLRSNKQSNIFLEAFYSLVVPYRLGRRFLRLALQGRPVAACKLTKHIFLNLQRNR